MKSELDDNGDANSTSTFPTHSFLIKLAYFNHSLEKYKGSKSFAFSLELGLGLTFKVLRQVLKFIFSTKSRPF